MNFKLVFAFVTTLLALAACTQLNTPPSTPTSPSRSLGAGMRFSQYGPAYNPGPQYWLEVANQMVTRFPDSQPQALWIVSELASPGTLFSFPGSSEDLLIHFSPDDKNEETLSLFDREGVSVWLQVEPGDAPVEKLIDILLKQYSHHPCVIGVGVDVEWYQSTETPEGIAVSDETAAAWLAVARKYNPAYRLFLKHWEIEMMPPTLREGILFVDDSQDFTSLDQMVEEFKAWGEAFAPAPVAFQFGYDADEAWWKAFEDPASEIGKRILAEVPNTQGLYWVDFTVLRVFPPER